MAEHDADYSLLVEFDTDEPEFTRGFEAGTLWGRLGAAPEPFTQTIHAANAEMAIRICEAKDRAFTAKDVGEQWVELSVGGAAEHA